MEKDYLVINTNALCKNQAVITDQELVLDLKTIKL